MEGYKLNDLKLKEFDSIQEMFDRASKRVNTFEDFRTELVEGNENRAGIELIQENAKKQSHRGPSDAMHNPPQPLKFKKTLVSKLMEITLLSIDFLTPRLLILKWRQSAPPFDY
ncbi:hypothetical protein Tco_0660761 [Tanacetum coccineum]